MMPSLPSLLVFLALAGTTSAAHAQASFAPGIVGAIRLAHKAARGDFDDKSVTAEPYRNGTFPVKRSVPEMLTGPAANQILFLEAQLDLCKAALRKDSTGTVCSVAQQNAIRTMQGEIYKAEPSWPLKAYRHELEFYQAEDARRQRLAAPRPAAK